MDSSLWLGKIKSVIKRNRISAAIFRLVGRMKRSHSVMSVRLDAKETVEG